MRIALILLIAGFLSCKPNSELIFSQEMIDKIPNEIIDPDKMADILVDVHLAESMIQESKDDSIKLNKDKVLSGYYGVIMKIHQVSQEEFVNSYNYYDEHPLILHYIHNTMTERLSLMESRYK